MYGRLELHQSRIFRVISWIDSFELYFALLRNVEFKTVEENRAVTLIDIQDRLKQQVRA